MSLSPRRSILVIHMCELRRQKTSHAVRICNCFFYKDDILKTSPRLCFFLSSGYKNSDEYVCNYAHRIHEATCFFQRNNFLYNDFSLFFHESRDFPEVISLY